jgi:hypothetical protein
VNRRWLLGAAAALLVAVGVAGCSHDDTSPPAASPPTIATDASDDARLDDVARMLAPLDTEIRAADHDATTAETDPTR